MSCGLRVLVLKLWDVSLLKIDIILGVKNSLLLQTNRKEYFTQGVNFINILRGPFLYESKSLSFLWLRFSFVIFGAKILYKKCAGKTLMKLTQDFSMWRTKPLLM